MRLVNATLAASTLLVAAALAAPSTAQAGDACPVSFVVNDQGTPPWLERDKVLDGLESQATWLGFIDRQTKDGVVLKHVYPGSPAAKAGLKTGHKLHDVNNVEVKTTKDLDRALRGIKPGQSISVVVHEPDDMLMDVDLTVGRRDPLVAALVRAGERTECAGATQGAYDGAAAKAIAATVFSEQRRFRCDDAHKLLMKNAELKDVLDPSQIIVVRGSKRVLLTSPGYVTKCVSAKSYDGTKLTATAAKALFGTLSKGYIARRKANP